MGVKRWKGWGLALVGVVAAGVAFDLARRAVSPPQGRRAARAPRHVPQFAVGDAAPDFSLPDHRGKSHRLSEVVKGDTLLTFLCGCAQCIDLQTFTGLMVKKMGERAPTLIGVTSMPPEREETYYRDTGLRQLLLYERKEGPVFDLYRGHPCPRAYRLRGDRTVAWIGTSPADQTHLQAIGMELANNLGFTQEEVMRMGPAGPPPGP